ncbi:DUF5651 domain-containing protein [Clostridium butyricum]|uniref:DUF5651 domain-containing protein n=1 Tax=Clostridium butyricum TaxID=1492 RepID=UPI00189E01ED|nr:DUF5651 domain-containing protein [Clostridium butyricum]MDB2150549.1 DUF5651 domain-containing protein [Clostridium butyricum]
MGNLKRAYLTSEEKNFYMISKAYIQYCDGLRGLDVHTNNPVWEDWKDRGMLTGTMQKNIKMTYTYLKKLLRDIGNNIKYAVIEREKLEPVLQDIAAVRCVGCTANYKKCPLYKMLDDISIPYVKECPTCPYACELSEYTEDELKNIERMREIIHKRKSVAKEFNRKIEYEDKKSKSKKRK